MLAMPGRRLHAECAVIAALISTASSVVGAAQFPVTAWLRSESANPTANEPIHQITTAADDTFAAEHYGQGRSVSSGHGTVLTALIRPAPVGDITPDPPPQVPPPALKPLVPPVAAPPPRAPQPQVPPRQEERPPPEPQAPAPEPQAPAPQPQGPPSGQEAPPAQPPPRGHVQLAP
jgi:hypothetical protein